MARPRIFVSSTYYDLKHLRSSIENFVESLGYDAILSEKGSIAYSPDRPLDESCYREVQNADIFVLILGGRYGSERSGGDSKLTREFYERYDSITKQEYVSAVAQDIPIYILVERNVYSEYQTFLSNKNRKDIKYAHVDSVNVFHLIEEILSQPRNNPFYTFERYNDIERWLKEQWAGTFRELLHRLSGQLQLASLQAQVSELGQINKTLKRYLEELISRVAPDESQHVIQSESLRLEEARRSAQLRNLYLVRLLEVEYNLPFEVVSHTLRDAPSYNEFIIELSKGLHGPAADELRVLSESPVGRGDYERGKKMLEIASGSERLEDLRLSRRRR